MGILDQAIEQERLAALRRENLLDSPSDEFFMSVVQRAAELMEAPGAAFSIVDEKRVWLKERFGIPFLEFDRADSFCATTVTTNRPQIVEDARTSERYRKSPCVAGEPHVRFYAGVPVRAGSGHALGALCVFDTKPRKVDSVQIKLLEGLAREFESHLKYRAVLEQLYAVSEQRALLSEAIVHDVGDAAVALSGALESRSSDDAARLAARCRDVSDRLHELALSAMRAGRRPAHGIPVNKCRVELSDWFDLVVKRLAGLACRHEIELLGRNELPRQLVSIDTILIERIAVKLVSSALAVLRPGQTMLVHAELEAGGLLALSVADNGPGIPAAVRDRIFSGISGSRTAGRSRQGEPLLASRLAAEALGGSLILVPRSDFGTEFLVRIPIAEFSH